MQHSLMLDKLGKMSTALKYSFSLLKSFLYTSLISTCLSKSGKTELLIMLLKISVIKVAKMSYKINKNINTSIKVKYKYISINI